MQHGNDARGGHVGVAAGSLAIGHVGIADGSVCTSCHIGVADGMPVVLISALPTTCLLCHLGVADGSMPIVGHIGVATARMKQWCGSSGRHADAFMFRILLKGGCCIQHMYPCNLLDGR